MRQPPKRVLCVEDHEDIRFLLTTALRGAGYDAAAAAGTVEAEGLARGGHFDLFVLDTRLDDGSGVDLCRTLLSIRPGARVVFYSAAAYDSDREEAMCAGACAYVAKPGIVGLLEAVRVALGDGQGLAAADESWGGAGRDHTVKSLRNMKRLKGLLRERRREARRPVRREAPLVAGLSFPGADGERRSFVGHAADLSESGLSLTVKDGRFGCGLLAAPGRVRIIIALPSATINFRASVAYCKAAGERRPDSGHVVGLRIDEIGGDERRRLKAFLDDERGRDESARPES